MTRDFPRLSVVQVALVWAVLLQSALGIQINQKMSTGFQVFHEIFSEFESNFKNSHQENLEIEHVLKDKLIDLIL